VIAFTSLDALLAPTPALDFARGAWDNRPQVFAGGGAERAAAAAAVLSRDDLDALLTDAGLRYPTFRLVDDSVEPPVGAYTEARTGWGTGHVTGLAHPDRVISHLLEGYSLVLEQVHRIWAPGARMVRAFEQAFHCRAQMAAALTPAGRRAFVPHYEVTNHFVLQCEGRSTWRVYQEAHHRPLARDACPPEGVAPGALSLEVTLSAGDLLYIPRGYVFEGRADAPHSLTATVSLAATTWQDVLMEAYKAYDHPLLRESVRLDISGPNRADDTTRARFREILEKFAFEADAEEALDQLMAQMVRTRYPLLGAQYANMRRAPTAHLDTWLRRRPGLMYRLVEEEDAVALHFHSKTLRFPTGTADTVLYMAESDFFPVRGLPGDINDLQKLTVCHSLIRGGFLEFYDA